MQTENLVSDRICKFVQAKADILQKLADKQDKFREKQVDLLEKEITRPKYLMGRIVNKYIILEIMSYSFYKQRVIIFLLGTSKSFR